MAAPLYRAAPAAARVHVDLAPFTAVYDRRSGITHLLAEPAPDILAALTDNPLSLDALHARLAARFEVDGDGLATRLAELVATGLVGAA